VILGLDRLLARVRGRAEARPEPEPGTVKADSAVEQRIDAARTRLRRDRAARGRGVIPDPHRRTA
jgi:hypothetical protein